MKTIVGMYNSVAEANKVKSALTSAGYDADRIRIIDQTSETSGTGYGDASTTGSSYSNTATGTDNESIGGKIKNFFSSFSTDEANDNGHTYDDRVHNSYTQGVTNGGALLAVTVADGEAERTADLLQQHGATEVEGGYQSGTERGYANTDESLRGTETTGRVTGEQVIPVVAEELQVGKRQVERGGVRIYSHVVSQQVSENVNLHDERVVVDRHAVNRPATEADFNPGERTMEVRAMGEEAVVGKRSRVVEEIRVGKEASDRTEQVSDTVRHTEVDVEPTVVDETTGVTGSKLDRR